MLAFLRSALLEYISSGDCFQSSSRCDTLSTPWARLQCVPASNSVVKQHFSESDLKSGRTTR